MKRPFDRALAIAASLTLAACSDAAPTPPPAATATTTATATASATATATAAPAPPADETLSIVTSETAPLMIELEDDENAPYVLRKGELLEVVREVRSLHWKAKMDGIPSTREGMGLEVRVSNGGVSFFTFQSDLGAKVTVPASRTLCERARQTFPIDITACTATLRRAKTPDGALLFYTPCTVGPCPIGLYRDGKTDIIAVDGVTLARFFPGKTRSVLLTEARWTADLGKQSGGKHVPILIEGDRLRAQSPIPTDSVDARDASQVKARLVQVKVTETEIAITGEEKVSAPDGKVLSTKKIDEKHPLPALQ